MDSLPTSLTNSSTMSSFLREPHTPVLNMLCDIAIRDFNLGPPPPPKKQPRQPFFRGWIAPVPYPLASRPSPRPRPSLTKKTKKAKKAKRAKKAKKAKKAKTVEAKLSDYLKPGRKRESRPFSAREKRLQRRRILSGKSAKYKKN